MPCHQCSIPWQNCASWLRVTPIGSGCLQAYGDVRTLYTACIGRGFCMISYYDLRAACLASHSLQGTLLAGSALNIHFSSPREGTPDHDEVWRMSDHALSPL